jgi:hypothetical protein
MKLSDWASVAEIVSGIAVVVTLMFLVLSIRENSDIMRASSFADTSDSLIELTRDIIRDDELSVIFQAWRENDISQLDARQMFLLTNMAVTMFRIYEKAFIAEQYDLLGPGEWHRFERTICLIYPRLQSADLADNLRVSLTDEFVQYMDSNCTPSD